MRIVFNMLRFNWYRVLSACVREALDRGWHVECWHGYDDEKAPVKTGFSGHVFKTRRYSSIDDYVGLLQAGRPDVVVDADPAKTSCRDTLACIDYKPYSVLIDGITNPRMLTGVPYIRYDCFATPSDWYTDQAIRMGTRDYHAVKCAIRRAQGEISEPLLERCFADRYVWTAQDVEHYRSHSTVVGTPSLDDLKLIDRDSIRTRWGIPEGKKVVALLPSPYDMSLGYLWGDLNMANHWWQVVMLAVKYGQVRQIVDLMRKPRDVHILKSIRRFADNNDAMLIAKLRHSRDARSSLKAVVDVIVGEDGYAPHTALELFAIADIVFGFTSSGAYEAVAAGASYVDIELPLFPKDLYIKHIAPSLEVAREWPNVVWSYPAEKLGSCLSEMLISQFKLNTDNARDYLNKYTSVCDGKSAARLMDWIEDHVGSRKRS